MIIDVVFLPAQLQPQHLTGRAVAVFDVLRATTTMTAALDAGISEIHLFGDVPAVRAAAADFRDPPLLMGEERCLPPSGFDLGNSPGAITRDRCFGRVALMSTTNGTKALIAARGAAVRFAAAIVNATAVARSLATTRRDITLLCAGTGGQVALEDVLGCGAVIASLSKIGDVTLAGDGARIAARLFEASRDDLRAVMADGDGGRNVIAAGLSDDIDFCSKLDVFDCVGVADDDRPIVRRLRS